VTAPPVTSERHTEPGVPVRATGASIRDRRVAGSPSRAARADAPATERREKRDVPAQDMTEGMTSAPAPRAVVAKGTAFG
jgi:hypothetical protein